MRHRVDAICYCVSALIVLTMRHMLATTTIWSHMIQYKTTMFQDTTTYIEDTIADAIWILLYIRSRYLPHDDSFGQKSPLLLLCGFLVKYLNVWIKTRWRASLRSQDCNQMAVWWIWVIWLEKLITVHIKSNVSISQNSSKLVTAFR